MTSRDADFRVGSSNYISTNMSRLTTTLMGLLCFFLDVCSTQHLITATASLTSSSSLELLAGLNFSLFTSYDASGSSNPHMLTTAVSAQHQGYFFPILSSPSFNRSNASLSGVGFSFGFLSSDSSPHANFYLALCGGISGDRKTSSGEILHFGNGDQSFETLSGYVTPLWVANLQRPLMCCNYFSLVVVTVPDAVRSSSSNQLQLRDDLGNVVWNVSNVGMMEIENSGNLIIYDSARKSNVVWNSSTQPKDTLLQGQRLTAGMELTSNDNSYSARMEKGGLVLYLNTVHFMQRPSPYWAFPIAFRNASLSNASFNTLIFSSPCSSPDELAFISLSNDPQPLTLNLESGSCNSENFSFILADLSDALFNTMEISWSFVRLENDGRLYAYAVNMVVKGTPLTQRYALDANGTAGYGLQKDGGAEISYLSSAMPVFSWGDKCDLPMRCGPLGVCRPDAADTCSCPPSLDPVNTTDSSQGCKRPTSLPHCEFGHEHISTTDFLQLNHTAAIFLFSGWDFNSTSATVDACKKLCSLDCSCNGFFYHANHSACFFLTDEVSLLNVTNVNVTSSINYTDPSNSFNIEIWAMNYITYLKVKVASVVPSAARKTNKVLIITVISSFVMACLILGLFVHFYLLNARKKKHSQFSKQARDEEELQDILPLLPSRFSYQDLHKATDGFSKLLGAGGCGSVYAGILSDGTKVAVKILEVLVKGQTKQFLAELATIGHTNHVNVVRLVGFCWEVSHRLLVYEYMERGSLDHWLFHNGHKLGKGTGNIITEISANPLLDWQTRYNVAIGIARGLSYLHEECTQPVLHFDIKPQNILLDDAFVAKLADFGMSRLMQRDISEVVTGVRGTPGYIAPEWISHGAVGKKSDIYSMGMVMLEIVGGRRNLDLALLNNTTLDSTAHDAWHFPSWAAKKCEQGSMAELVDKRLRMCGFDPEQMERLIHTAFWCIQENPSLRPYAPDVVQWLEGSSSVKQPPFSKCCAHNSVPANDSY